MRIVAYGTGLFLAAVLATGAGTANADPMQSFYGNTVVITYPNGVKAKLHVKDGGAYDLVLPDGTTANGVWAIEGDQFCTTRMTPAPQPKQCRPAISRTVGDRWDEDTPNGKVSYEMTAGQ
jgi:hypothetical protein